jgi:hypothetical protein
LGEVETPRSSRQATRAAIDDLSVGYCASRRPPRSGLSRSDLVRWPITGTTTDDPDGRLLRYCGRHRHVHPHGATSARAAQPSGTARALFRAKLPQPCGLWMHGALPIEIVGSSPTMTSLGGSISSRARSSDLPHEPERSLHQILHPPAFVHRRTRKQPVLERVAVAAGRARSGGAAVHAAAVFAAHGGRHAGMAGAGRRAAATARQHRAGVTRASHLCARAAPGPARVPAGSAASSARRRAV